MDVSVLHEAPAMTKDTIPPIQRPYAFAQLPDEIIEQILQSTDPNSFASLILLNSKWRRVSQQAHLYAHHLSRCSSYSSARTAVNPASVQDGDLPKLRRLFAREIKRNLFEVYLRPKTTTIKLISNSISSSSVPGGEGMQFSPSARGHHLLAYNSSRIYVLDVRRAEIQVSRELKILRRPVSACILDDGTVLAVLSSDMQVDLYDLKQQPPKRAQSLILDHSPRTIALSPCGSVLAAAYEGGIEVSSLHNGALSTDRRAVKCDGVDHLAFSFDGTQLLGTTTSSHQPNTVILTAPYYDPGAQMGEDNISALWTTSILFPNTSRDCSHAVLLQESSSQEATWTFTYDRSFETFRAVRIDDLRNGTTYFTGPIPHSQSQTTLLPCTLPAASYCGDLVSAGFDHSDVWLYGVPEDLEAASEMASTSDASMPMLNRRSSAPSVRSATRGQESSGGRVPQWQLLCDRNRNTFTTGRKVAALTGVNSVNWVADHGQYSLQERLIVAARGIQPPKLITEEDGIDFVDGGRLTILDFDNTTSNGVKSEITIEVGTQEPEVLEEEHRDIATEVAIVRRRTVVQRSGGRPGIMRAATSAARHAEFLLRSPAPPVPTDEPADEDPLIPRRMTASRNEANTSSPTPEEPEDVSLEEAQEALDAPYAHASPRSGTTLRRAATAVAVNRRLNPAAATSGRFEHRRADGRPEHPHESDADNWVPPPPPYAKDDPGDVPVFLRHAPIPGAGLDANVQDVTTARDNHVAPPLAPMTIAQPGSPAALSPASSAAVRIPPQRSADMPGRSENRTLSARHGQFRSSWQQGSSYPRTVSNPTHTSESRSENSLRPASSPTDGYATRRHSFHPSMQSGEDGDYSPAVSNLRRARASNDMVQDGRTPDHRHSVSISTASSNNSRTATLSSSTSSSHTAAIRAPTLNLSIPSSVGQDGPFVELQPSSSQPVQGLPNPQTWPRAPSQQVRETAGALEGYPHSAPPTNVTNAEVIGACLPPAPTSDQLASLHRRRESGGAPRRASGSFQLPAIFSGRRPLERTRPNSIRMGHHSAMQSTSLEPEQPLIISTPKGVTGAFDSPVGQVSQTMQMQPVLHAPVPRHPYSAAGTSPLRPTVERLETIYSVHSTGGGNPGPLNASVQTGYDESGSNPSGQLSAQLTANSLRHHTSLTRRQSRARRSAAKNVQDAKSRGWTGRRKRKKDTDAVSSTWTDVTWASRAPRDPQAKDRKCAVM